MSCVRFTPIARFYRNVLRSVHACCLPQSAKQDGLRGVAFLFRRGSRSPFVRSRGTLRLSAFVGSLRVWLFLYGDLDGVTTGVGYTKRNAVFVQRSFCYKFMIRYDTAGRTLGLRAPDCAKESSTLWTLFTLRRGWVGAYTRRRHPGTIGDPPDSDKRRPHCGWSGRSCITARQQVDAGTAGLSRGL